MHIDDVIGHFYSVVVQKITGGIKTEFYFWILFSRVKKKFHSLAALVHKILFFVTGK